MPSKPRVLSGLMPDIGSMQAWYALRDELLDRIDNLEDVVGASSRRLDATANQLEAVSVTASRAHEAHCITVSDVRSLINSSTSLDSRFQSFEIALRQLQSNGSSEVTERIRACDARLNRAFELCSRDQASVVESVQSLLAEMRAEFSALRTSVDRRCNEAESTARKAEIAAAAAQSQAATLENRVAALNKELHTVHSHVSDARVALKEGEAATRMAIEAARQDLRDAFKHDIANSVSGCEARCQQLIDQLAMKTSTMSAQVTADLDSALDMISQKLNNRCGALEERQVAAIRGLESFGDRVGELQSLLEDTTAMCRAVDKRCDDMSVALRRDTRPAIDALTAAQDAISVSIGEQRSQLQSKLDAMTTKFDATSHQLHALESATSSRFDQYHGELVDFRDTIGAALDQRTQALGNDVAALQRDFDGRLKKLVESTHQALERLSSTTPDVAGAVASMRHDLGVLKDSVQLHSTAIERWRVDSIALVEIKDWLQDLERRAASKAEVEQVAAAISASVAASRDAAHNSEAVLAQRIEAERSAREYESTSLRSMLHRVQSNTRGLGVASP